MGLKFSKKEAVKDRQKLNMSNVQHYLVRYLSTNSYVRSLVSKQRRRLLVEGYDLDMSYITDRILAMSFPAERMRAMYRNPLWQVKSVLDMRHSDHYKIYNLCIEENYDASHFHGRVERFPFDDNHVPPLQMIKKFCESVHKWISTNPSNIAVVHCMAGNGRTGLMVCCYLVYNGMSTEEALQLYAQKRTKNNNGVSIPSQRRYVEYWANSLAFSIKENIRQPTVKLPDICGRELRRIRLYDTLNIEAVFFVVSELHEVADQEYYPPVEVARNFCRRIKKGYQRSNSPRYYYSFIETIEDEKTYNDDKPHVVAQMDTESPIIYEKNCLDYHFNTPLLVTGDVRVIFYHKMNGGRIFYVCFNTAFIEKGLLQFSKQDLDKVGYKGKSICGLNFCVELLFGPANTKFSTLSTSDNEDETIDDTL